MSLEKYATDVERQISAQIVDDALKAGYTVSVSDGEEFTVVRSTDREVILGAMATTDQDVLVFRDDAGAKIGWVQLIWGNDHELISNSSVGGEIEALLAGAEALASALSGT